MGAQPEDGSRIPGIRKWSDGYLPAFFEPMRVDRIELVNQATAEATTRRLAADLVGLCSPRGDATPRSGRPPVDLPAPARCI
jgi:hypothetical protein